MYLAVGTKGSREIVRADPLNQCECRVGSNLLLDLGYSAQKSDGRGELMIVIWRYDGHHMT